MKLEDRFEVYGSPEVVSDFMLDIDRVRGCVPEIADVKEIGPNAYEASLVVRLGPIKASFQGSVEVDAAGAPNRLSAVAQGKDRASGSVAKVLVEARLDDLPDQRTAVEVVTDVTIRGKLGQYGTAVIRSTATAVTNDFAKCLDARLRADGAHLQADGAAVETAAPTPRRGRVARLGFASLVTYIKNLWSGLRNRFRRRGDGKR